jgi:diguanylate cyclase (GGDEF)-like protein
VLRDDLYLFLAFLLVCAVIILIASGIQDEPRPQRAAQPGQAPAEVRHRFEPEPIRSQARAPAAPPLPEPVAPVREQVPPVWEQVPPVEEPVPAREPVRRPAARDASDWRAYLEPRLQTELSRAQSSDQDLALARVRVDQPRVDARLPLVIAAVTRLVRESFPLHDLIFESGDDSCTILIPEAEIDDAVHSLDDLRKKVAAAPLEARIRTVSIGVSSRAGRLIDGVTLLEEADISLEKATREGGNQVIGFRADAARFRETLTGTPA